MSTAKKTNAKTTAEATKAVEAAVASSKETVEAVVKAGSEAATKQYEKTVSMTKEQVEKTASALFQGYDEIQALNKQNLDAVMKSSTVFSKGFEKISKEWMGFTQAALEANVANAKALMGVKNVKDAIDMQSAYARTSFDKAMAESAKLTEMSVKVTNDAIKPLQDQANITVQKMMKPIAA